MHEPKPDTAVPIISVAQAGTANPALDEAVDAAQQFLEAWLSFQPDPITQLILVSCVCARWPWLRPNPYQKGLPSADLS
jgi:hypothetical protein